MRNYQSELDNITAAIKTDGTRPHLLLHACCAPCSSYVLEYLSPFFYITLYFYNPNISSKEEYDKRYAELVHLLSEMGLSGKVDVIYADYDVKSFEKVAVGREDLSEGGARCFDCYRLRLESAAAVAKDLSCDYFTTTLSISPHKRSDWINDIGEDLAKKYGVPHLPSDFKKRGGYKRSCELSVQYGLYRQNFCGCEYSRIESEIRRKGEK